MESCSVWLITENSEQINESAVFPWTHVWNLWNSQCSIRGHLYFFPLLFSSLSWPHWEFLDHQNVVSKNNHKKQTNKQTTTAKPWGKSKHKFKSSLVQLNKHCFWHFIRLTWLTCLLSTNATKASEFQGKAPYTLFLCLLHSASEHHLEKRTSVTFLVVTSF